MPDKDFNIEKYLDYWITSSDDDFETMMTLFENNRYSFALFVGHLSVEKLLKALYIKIHNAHPPFIHNLLRLAELNNLDLSDDKKLFFATVTAFNINTRYDDYKMSFKQKCTYEYTSFWIEKIKENREWIMKFLIQ
ncbi:MAG: HEPN domain-containing protein [Candidatus Kapabacteria bacterium]|nr:HEPN domain-containing protein [Candidatus Kapabacteria bacterium]